MGPPPVAAATYGAAGTNAHESTVGDAVSVPRQANGFPYRISVIDVRCWACVVFFYHEAHEAHEEDAPTKLTEFTKCIDGKSDFRFCSFCRNYHSSSQLKVLLELFLRKLV